MEQVVYEAPKKTVRSHELVDSLFFENMPTREAFEHASTNELALVREVSRRHRKNKKKIVEPGNVRQAELLFKESSLELFFRIHGDKYRKEYKEWFEIKQKKQHEWEGKMLGKYGPEWRRYVTAADCKLVVFSESEKEVYARHLAIEAKAMKLKKRTIRKFQKKMGKKERGEKKEGDFFKMVIEKTLVQYQFLSHKEVKNAVYSLEFLLFYIRLMVRSIMKKEIIPPQQSSESLPAHQEMQEHLFEGVNYAKEIAMRIRKQKINRIVGNVNSENSLSTFFV